MMDIPFIGLERYRITIQHYLNGEEIELPKHLEYCLNAGGIPRSIVINEMMEKLKEIMLKEASRKEKEK